PVARRACSAVAALVGLEEFDGVFERAVKHEPDWAAQRAPGFVSALRCAMLRAGLLVRLVRRVEPPTSRKQQLDPPEQQHRTNQPSCLHDPFPPSLLSSLSGVDARSSCPPCVCPRM